MRAEESHRPRSPAQVFGLRVREIRERRGLTQAELARRLSVDRTTLNKLENGVRGDVSISQLFGFAMVLGVSPVHLLTPHADGEAMQVLGEEMTGTEARRWIRGEDPPPGANPDTWFVELPVAEQYELLRGGRPGSGPPSALVLALSRNRRSQEELADEMTRRATAIYTREALGRLLELPPDQRAEALEQLIAKREETDG
jgi:transcriptional regulator with XRE-family HTH domain